MKSKTIFAMIAVVILIVAGTVFFFWQRGPHLPRAQTPQPPGTFIPKNQLLFAGYKTPEAAAESTYWAYVHGDYDTAIASLQPNQRAKMKKQFGNPKNFKSEYRIEFSQMQVKGVEIVARKNVSNDKVELKFQIVENEGIHKDKTNLMVFPVVKIGKEWKFFGDFIHYETNWDNSGDVVTFAEYQSRSPDSAP